MKERIGLLLLLVLLTVQPAAGAILWYGTFRVESASPWKITIVESHTRAPTLPLRSEKTGLPTVSADHWVCTGRLPEASDVGKVYEFVGMIPDIGGHYSFESDEQSLAFRSKWSDWSYASNGILILLATLGVLAIVYWIRKLSRQVSSARH